MTTDIYSENVDGCNLPTVKIHANAQLHYKRNNTEQLISIPKRGVDCIMDHL